MTTNVFSRKRAGAFADVWPSILHVRTRFTPGSRLVAAMRTGVGSGLTFGKVSAGNGQDMPTDETE